jgi:hypothetical protein
MEFDLGSSGFSEVQYDFTTSECNELLIALKKFLNEYESKNYDIFCLEFIKSIHKSSFINACNFFHDLSQNNETLLSYLDMLNTINKTDADQSSINFGGLMELDDHIKIIPTVINLQTLCTALRIKEYFHQETKVRSNENINESNDWTPPDNFQYGTDKEKEIWRDFTKYQIIK